MDPERLRHVLQSLAEGVAVVEPGSREILFENAKFFQWFPIEAEGTDATLDVRNILLDPTGALVFAIVLGNFDLLQGCRALFQYLLGLTGFGRAFFTFVGCAGKVAHGKRDHEKHACRRQNAQCWYPSPHSLSSK